MADPIIVSPEPCCPNSKCVFCEQESASEIVTQEVLYGHFHACQRHTDAILYLREKQE